MNNVFITGANGFIGSALCQKMVSAGYYVVGAKRSQRSLILSERIKYVDFDLHHQNYHWNSVFSNIDTVIHLAARVHLKRIKSSDSLEHFFKVNVQGTENLARHAAERGVKRFVFLSSVKVHGDENVRAYREIDKPNPKDPYATSKLYAEQLLQRISAETEMAVTILRPPLVYGPGVQANFLELMNVVNKQRHLPLAGVDNRRSFIYLENLVDAILTCIQNPAAAGQTYLLNDGQNVSTPALIRMLAEALGVEPKLFGCPPLLLFIGGRLCGKGPAIDRLIGSLTVDATKITQELGWHPPFTMSQGLQKTAQWFRTTYRSKQ